MNLRRDVFQAIAAPTRRTILLLLASLKKNPEPLPDELLQAFEEDPAFRTAFYALTPGRQRGYVINFSQPKQSQTRVGRIEKYKNKFLTGWDCTINIVDGGRRGITAIC